MLIDIKTTEKFIKKVKDLTDGHHGFYTVFSLKDKCMYHFDPEKNNPNIDFKYSDLRLVKRDVESNLNYHINNLVTYHNQTDTEKYRWDSRYSMDDYDFKDIEREKLNKLTNKDLEYVGCLEMNPLFTRKKLSYLEIPEGVSMGTHLHLFFRNRTHLNPDEVISDFMLNPKHKHWKSMIGSVASSQICDRDFYDKNNFINYHIKQMHGDYCLLSSDSNKKK